MKITPRNLKTFNSTPIPTTGPPSPQSRHPPLEVVAQHLPDSHSQLIPAPLSLFLSSRFLLLVMRRIRDYRGELREA